VVVSSSGLFAGIELAKRIERAECGLLRSGVEAAAKRDPARGARVIPIAGGVATWGGDGSPFNKVAGVGFAGAPPDREIDLIERAFLERGAPVRFEVSTLADPAVGRALTRRGYVLAGFENVLGLALEGPPARGAAPEGIRVARCGDADLDGWLDVVVTGFAHPDDQGIASDEEFPREALERVFGDLGAAEGFARYLARRDGAVAGGASMRMGEGVALLCGAATLPAHRRRGVQSAMLATRLAEASAAGCDLAVVTTQPGSKSQQNVQRQGFQLLYARAVLMRER
jgi:GNAT superfamily N-acetyltransferase